MRSGKWPPKLKLPRLLLNLQGAATPPRSFEIMKVRVNAKNVSVRRLAGLVISTDIREVDVTAEQFAALANDEYVSVKKLEEDSNEQEPVIFGKKLSEYTAADIFLFDLL